MRMKEVIEEMVAKGYEGVHLTKKNGIITTTWLLYKRGIYFYYFDINQSIEFMEYSRYSENELIEELEHGSFRIDTEVY
jgi:hypothetical protein